MDDKDQNPRLRRVQWMYGMIFASLASLILRLAYVQIGQGAELRQEAQNTMLAKLPVAPARGWIYDANGQLLAYDQPSFDVILTRLRSKQQDYHAMAQLLAPVFHMKASDLENTMANKLGYLTQITLLEGATPEQISFIEEHQTELPGLEVVPTPERVYPYGDLACHILGYLGSPSPDDMKLPQYQGYNPQVQKIGKAGVEAEYESILQGTLGEQVVETNSLGVPLRYLGYDPAPQSGSSIRLTVDGHLQAMVQQYIVDELKTVREKYGYVPQDVEVVVLDVKTGGVLAMASYPYYDPNWFVPTGGAQVDQAQRDKYMNQTHAFYNYAIMGKLQLGSTVKPVNTIAGLMSGVITPDTTISDPGYVRIGNDVRHDWQPGGHGLVNPVKAIQESCDTFFYYLGLWLGKWHGGVPAGESLAEWSDTDRVKGLNTLFYWEWLFGLGQFTGIDLPGEEAGYFFDDNIDKRDPKKVISYDYPLLTAMQSMAKTGKFNDRVVNPTDYKLTVLPLAGIGQQQYVTPIELAQYALTLATNGKRLQPHVLDAILNPDGSVKQQVQPVVLDTINVKPQYWQVVKQGMYDVCNAPGGTAYGSFHDAPYKAAGKTGTAQYLVNGQMQNISMFIGYAPADNPQVAIAVRVPGGGESSEAAVPLARQVLDEYFKEHHEFFPPNEWTSTAIPSNWKQMTAYTSVEDAVPKRQP
ncbi:MAG: penicillin-binding protein 2 [Thermoflavifilum sp.]|nr:penicillin-binding protein 2 [Thermoflavifilum sp.]MCL6513634.1 penicillin-binding protein 2 [Alicyclobacillus sp.]